MDKGTGQDKLDPEAVEVNWDCGEDAHKGAEPGGQERGNAELDPEMGKIKAGTQEPKAKQRSREVTGERGDVGVSIELSGATLV